MASPPGHLPLLGPSLLDTARATTVRERLLCPGERVLVAVSGGPDSVALLDVLLGLAPEYALDVRAVHVHHGLRAAADRDAEFVERLAARLGVPLTVERVAVARGRGHSPEDAARHARYAALARVAGAVGAARVALGHTADDQAETVLMRVLQGAGPRGLAGIPARRGPFVRPLLDADRAAVLRHLAVHDLPWVEDESNRDRTLLRNRIRHDLLPLIETGGFAGTRTALRRTARVCREAITALDDLAAREVARGVRPSLGGTLVALDVLRELPAAVAKGLIRRAVLQAAPGGVGGLREAHLRALHALTEAPIGTQVRLPRGLVVERAARGLWVVPRPASSAPVPLVVPGETCFEGSRLRLEVDVLPAVGAPPAASAWEAWFDHAGMPLPLVVRQARPGDRLVPFGGGTPVRVSRLLAAAGHPRAGRRSWPLVVARRSIEEDVLWVVGVRRAREAPVTPETRTIVRIRAVVYPEAPGTREEWS
jgi:tRNA(Ile)-lysidine synthase